MRKPETGRNKSRDLGIDGIAIQNWISEAKCKDVGWTHLAQDGLQWRAVVNMVINFGVVYKSENFLTS
jgi:hypothetical protein